MRAVRVGLKVGGNLRIDGTLNSIVAVARLSGFTIPADLSASDRFGFRERPLGEVLEAEYMPHRFERLARVLIGVDIDGAV